MSRFPKIDSPCPLSAAEQTCIGSHCSRCGKPVHRLDGMDETQRHAFLKQAAQPVCVSYRIPLGAAAALALSLTGPVLASSGEPSSASPTTPQSIAPALPHTPLPAGRHDAMASAQSTNAEIPKEISIVMVGGITMPGEAEWIDGDTTLPELPMVREPRSAQ